MGVTMVAPATGDASRFAPAVALGLVGANRDGAPLDFLHSKLAPPKKQRIGRKTVWAAVVLATLGVTFGVLGYDVHQRQAKVAQLQSQLDQKKDPIKNAKTRKEMIGTARGWFEGRPPTLECLRELTLAFNDNEPVFATSFSLGEDRKGQIDGQSSEQKHLALKNRIQSNKKFADVSLKDSHVKGGNSREWNFSISFTYVGLDDLSAKPAPASATPNRAGFAAPSGGGGGPRGGGFPSTRPGSGPATQPGALGSGRAVAPPIAMSPIPGPATRPATRPSTQPSEVNK
jgi:hypothetical protein